MDTPGAIGTELQVGAAAVFDAVAWEIELAGARCIQLDTIIGELMPSMPADQRERMLEGLHVVDLLAQHLTGLSAFMRRIGEDAAVEGAVPVGRALDDVTLGALADRLATTFGVEEQPVDDACAAGDCDLF